MPVLLRYLLQRACERETLAVCDSVMKKRKLTVTAEITYSVIFDHTFAPTNRVYRDTDSTIVDRTGSTMKIYLTERLGVVYITSMKHSTAKLATGNTSNLPMASRMRAIPQMRLCRPVSLHQWSAIDHVPCAPPSTRSSTTCSSTWRITWKGWHCSPCPSRIT